MMSNRTGILRSRRFIVVNHVFEGFVHFHHSSLGVSYQLLLSHERIMMFVCALARTDVISAPGSPRQWPSDVSMRRFRSDQNHVLRCQTHVQVCRILRSLSLYVYQPAASVAESSL